MKSIHINAGGSEKWVGGLYYKRNLLFSLLQNDYINQNFKIYVTVPKKFVSLFLEFDEKIILYSVKNYDVFYKFHHLFNLIRYRVKYTYPSEKNEIYDKLGIKGIQWIPDLQHKYYPDFFSVEEIVKRDTEYEKSDEPLVLSSLDSLKSYNLFYTQRDSYVVHFVSYIKNEIYNLGNGKEKIILRRLGLNASNYICISNQFWQHKNHIVVLKAIEILSEKNPDFEFKFVFTGEPKDYRNLDYYNQLMRLFNKDEIKSRTKVLGFMNRMDQLAIMKNAKFIIQPSLFEGWGTVVEDAKVLDKLILLSDIPVHHEQMNENCILFNPYNPEELADKIVEMSRMEHVDDVKKGIKDMYMRAREYSKNFQQMLEDLEAMRR